MPPSRPYRFSCKNRMAFLILIAAIQVPLANAETWIVTDRNHPVQAPAHVRVILLDESERLEAKLSEGLPANQQQAIAIIQQRLKSNDAQRLQRDLALAQQNLVDAWSMGVGCSSPEDLLRSLGEITRWVQNNIAGGGAGAEPVIKERPVPSQDARHLRPEMLELAGWIGRSG
ncbi:TIGR03757 family integrating conjugative element protein [Pseudomonas alliivorans]|nr:TIGR03757 family integrating conjugative element protein [Pseudomonas alliivorans]MEE4724004.1 TIGR03757 family integrating conjugative element protein [Pseudomonas alliivorans]MEE4760061.1 TIGR03757 family integrating conjugative element protein [Pseudomonas alliivorans]MEE4765199.1 TIGR03757 family integrating conjugative element protein [Pseudomonas alliivorans]MEE4775334.1 TIGR03757 family integrating conjugative element protein [Pseudomonas alliivorans]